MWWNWRCMFLTVKTTARLASEKEWGPTVRRGNEVTRSERRTARGRIFILKNLTKIKSAILP